MNNCIKLLLLAAVIGLFSQWEIYKIEYKYDSRGNWINKKETNKTPNLPQYDSWGYPINYNTPDTARDIEYY